jgi:hypothetical protein
MPRYGAEVIPVCEPCDALEHGTNSCKKCAVSYCKHFASCTDVRYCGNCISDFSIRETIMEKVVEHERPDGSITFSRKYQAKRITLMGNDWLFAAHLIEEMRDDEIEATIEYHRENVALMLQERESRKLERIRKLSSIKISNVKHETAIEREKREAKEAKKAGKTTRTRTKETSAEDLVKMLGELLKSGLSLEQIQALGKK